MGEQRLRTQIQSHGNMHTSKDNQRMFQLPQYTAGEVDAHHIDWRRPTTLHKRNFAAILTYTTIRASISLPT